MEIQRVLEVLRYITVQQTWLTTQFMLLIYTRPSVTKIKPLSVNNL